MFKLIFTSLIFYFIYKIGKLIIPFFMIKNAMNVKKNKNILHKKIEKMDIQDAEYEDAV